MRSCSAARPALLRLRDMRSHDVIFPLPCESLLERPNALARSAELTYSTNLLIDGGVSHPHSALPLTPVRISMPSSTWLTA